MRVKITISAGPWNQNFAFGKAGAKVTIVKGAVNIMTVGIVFSIKV